jgi:hypothetical protein
MGSRIISPAVDTCLWDVRGKKILKPVDIVVCCPAFISPPIEAMNRDDATID